MDEPRKLFPRKNAKRSSDFTKASSDNNYINVNTFATAALQIFSWEEANGAVKVRTPKTSNCENVLTNFSWKKKTTFHFANTCHRI